MAEITWIKLSTDIFNNRKIKMLEAMPDGDAIIVIWLKLLALAGTVNDNGAVYFTHDLPYTPSMLATEFARPVTTVELALKTFEMYGMISIIESIIYISNWEKYQNVDGMEKVREQTRLRVAKYREKQKMLLCNVTSNATVTQSNEVESEKEIDININLLRDYVVQDHDTDVSDCSAEPNEVTEEVQETEKVQETEEVKETEEPKQTKQFKKIQEEWNSLKDIGIAPIRSIGQNSNRAKLLRARIREYGFGSFREVVSQIRDSTFLQGQGSKGWMVTFDWVIKPNNYPKVLEGNYRNFDKQPPQQPRARNFVDLQRSPSYVDISELEKQLVEN